VGENADRVRRAYEAFNRRDVDALLDLVDDDIEFVSVLAAVEGASYRGREGIRRYVDDLRDAWADYRWLVERVVEVDEHTVVGVVTFKGRGRGSGMEMENRLATVFRLRGGLGWRIEAYTDVEEAFAAAGFEG
jgi:ketosteroid isomerase-like protein